MSAMYYLPKESKAVIEAWLQEQKKDFLNSIYVLNKEGYEQALSHLHFALNDAGEII